MDAYKRPTFSKLPTKIRFHHKILKSAGRAIAMFWLDIIEIGLSILKSYFEEKYIQSLLKRIDNQINILAEQRFNQAFESGEITKFRFGKELEGGYQLYFKIEINAYRLPFIRKSDQQVTYDLIFDGNINTHEFMFYTFDLSDIKIVRHKGASKFPDVNNNADFKNYPNVILYNEIFETGEVLTEGSEDAADERFNIIQTLVYNPFSVKVNYSKEIPVPGTTMLEDKRRSYVRDFRTYINLFPLSMADQEWKKLSITTDGKPRLEFEQMLIGLGFLGWEKSFHFSGKNAVEILSESGISWAMEIYQPIAEAAKRELQVIGSRDSDKGRQLYLHSRKVYDSVTLPDETARGCSPQNRATSPFRVVVRPWGQKVVERLGTTGWQEENLFHDSGAKREGEEWRFKPLGVNEETIEALNRYVTEMNKGLSTQTTTSGEKIISQLPNGVVVTTLNYKKELIAYLKTPQTNNIGKFGKRWALGIQFNGIAKCVNPQKNSYFEQVSKMLFDDKLNLDESNLNAYLQNALILIDNLKISDMNIK